MKNTYEHAIAIFLERYMELVKAKTWRTDADKFYNSTYDELIKFYNYINSDNITYTHEDELNYLKVRYLAEKFIHYYNEELSFIKYFRLAFIYLHIIILVNSQLQWVGYCK